MATRRYSINRGEQKEEVVEAAGAATATKKIEVTIDLASGVTREDALKGLREIENYITEHKWPPA